MDYTQIEMRVNGKTYFPFDNIDSIKEIKNIINFWRNYASKTKKYQFFYQDKEITENTIFD